MTHLVRSLLLVLTFVLLAAPAYAVDEDEDGFEPPEDCDDQNAAIHPDALEYCDNVDNDCDTLVDEDDVDDFLGADGDGDGDPADVCGGMDCDDTDPLIQGLDEDGDGSSLCSLVPDCDDTDADANPENPEEICGDGIDNDCSGVAEDLDLDGDESYSEDCGGDDCDDDNPSISPAAGEVGASCIDLFDNDCDCTGDTNGDGEICGPGDEGVDGLDDDCFAPPVPDAGTNQQDRFTGGVAIIVLDGSGTTDDNYDDVLTYTWTVTPREDYPGITWELVADPASAYGFLRFHADAGTDATEWIFDAVLDVSDGIEHEEDDDESPAVTATFFRPTFLSRIGCSSTGGARAGLFTLLFGLVALVGLRRR
jgi:MYXO-CTERM domain-containing protein